MPGLAASWLALLDFGEPWWLVLLVLIVPVVYVWKTSLVPASPLRRWVSLGLRVALILAVVGALAGTRVVWRNTGVCVVFVVDQSESVPEAARAAIHKQIEATVQKMRKDDRFAVVEFGGDAVLGSLPGPKGTVATPAVSDRVRTDIARALRLAMASFPGDRQKRIVICTDGNQNVGDAVREARIAAATPEEPVEIDSVMLTMPVGHEVMVEQVVLPPRVLKDAHFPVRTIISSDQAQPAELLISRDGESLPTQQIQLRAGTNVFDVPDALVAGGLHSYRVTVVPKGGPDADTFPQNNTGNGFTQVDAPGRVLVVHGKERKDDFLSDALTLGGIDVERGLPGLVPADAKRFGAYDCVVLDNVNARSLTQPQMAALKSWVQDSGGGLVIVGGDDSFGPGGYKGTDLEELSPVDMDVKRKKHLASVAIAVVLDKSGSMGMAAKDPKLTKMDLANQGAVEVIKLLSPADEAQIGAVDTEVKWMTADGVVPMTEINKSKMASMTLGTRAGGGGIYCKTALDRAYRWVTAPSVNAMARHVILFADADDSEQPEGCIEMARRYLNSSPQVTLTVIGLGTPKDSDYQFQVDLARAGGGRNYITDDAMALPKIFVKEAFIASRNAFVEKKEGIQPRIYDSPLLEGMRRGVPRVYGYVGTTLKPRAALAAHGLEVDDPLIAHWSTGLGKCVAFTSDVSDRWGRDWVAWEGFNKFWSQAVRWASKSMSDSSLVTTTTVENKEGRIVVQATGSDGKPVNNLALRANVQGPVDVDQAKTTTLRQVGPGRYEGGFGAGPEGTYVVTVVNAAADGGKVVDRSAAVLSYLPEFRDLQPNAALLKTMAETTGGRVLTGLEEVFKPKAHPVNTYWPAWEWLLIFAAAALLMDVSWRRLNMADWFQRQPTQIVKMGAGQALGALKSIRAGREGVEQQRSDLRQRLAVAEARLGADMPPTAGIAGSGVEAPPPVPLEAGAAQGAAATKGETATEGYTNRLLGAKRRAAEVVKEKEDRKG